MNFIHRWLGCCSKKESIRVVVSGPHKGKRLSINELTGEIYYDEVVWPKPIPERAKTDEDLAREILVKHRYCPIHFLPKEEMDFNRRVCSKCREENRVKAKLEADKHRATKELEIAFAISVLSKEAHAPSK